MLFAQAVGAPEIAGAGDGDAGIGDAASEAVGKRGDGGFCTAQECVRINGERQGVWPDYLFLLRYAIFVSLQTCGFGALFDGIVEVTAEFHVLSGYFGFAGP